MKRDFLEGLGIGKDSIDAIMAENGKDIEKYKSQASAQKMELSELADKLEKTQQRLVEFESVNIDEIRKSAEDFEAKWHEEQENGKKNLTAMKFDYAVNDALSKAKVKNSTAVRALLDFDLVSFDDDKLSGLNEQLSNLKEQQDFLFEHDEPIPTIIGSTIGQSTSPHDAVKAAMGLK